MTYESIDWEAYARQVAAAFAVTTSYTFGRGWNGDGKIFLKPEMYIWANDPDYEWRKEPDYETFSPCSGDLRIWVSCCRDVRQFAISREEDNYSDGGILLDWNGIIVDATGDFIYAVKLAEGLHCLNLLSPNLEAALKINITSHQKIEWLRDYEERLMKL